MINFSWQPCIVKCIYGIEGLAWTIRFRHGGRLPSGSLSSKQQEILPRLSSAVDCGRWFFPMKRRRRTGTRSQPHIAVSGQHIAEHHSELTFPQRDQRRMAALADCAVGRFVYLEVRSPRGASVFGDRAVKPRALRSQVEPHGCNIAVIVGSESMEALSGGRGRVIHPNGLRPRLAAIQRPPSHQIPI